ncbi:hypothetical protein O6H91_01G031200 [Diphasiastrum complanatum]|uniref:Uncharacterized protein n=2 Tax=Diphasiastrum complanatum TaxID=34168 RepID=A0ACC2EPL9_DIPCM|nr:hypothetical protein O6H91_01G031200 [Diphasiastrum complanatum]KAJ7568401.1 hypothetical protein O6H91_01G031200 [Diphasiastrum complanatum]
MAERRRYSVSPSPPQYFSRSRSRSPGRNYGRRDDAVNPGNNLYVTGLSTRVTERDLEDYFSGEGKVLECRLVVDPRTRESRGFAFVTMDTLEDADRCIKYLDRSTLEGRVITVEKAKRKRARTPTPGTYLGVRTARGNSSYRDYDGRRGSHGSPRDGYTSRRSPSYSPYRNHRDHSPDYPPYSRGKNRRRERSPSPRYSSYRSSRRRSYSPRRSYRRSYSPYQSRSRSRSMSRSHSRSRSPYGYRYR